MRDRGTDGRVSEVLGGGFCFGLPLDLLLLMIALSIPSLSLRRTRMTCVQSARCSWAQIESSYFRNDPSREGAGILCLYLREKS